MSSSDDARRAIEARCLAALGRREYSRAELAAKLGEFPAEDVAAVLETLAERGWQSDARFAESYLRGHRGYGRLKMRHELEARGIRGELLRETLDSADWFAAAPAARGLSASADAGQSDDPEERGRSRARQAAMAMTGAEEEDDAILLKGASALSAPSSRVETHWAGVLVAIVLFPLAWFLVHDGAATLTGGNPSAWPSAASPMGALEILGGTAACAAALFMISRSSLGAFVVGALSTVIGLPFILMPGVTKSILGPTVNRLQAHSDLGKALSTYVMDDGLSGRFILMGVLTIMVAVVGHVARRSGRRTQDEGRGPRD